MDLLIMAASSSREVDGVISAMHHQRLIALPGTLSLSEVLLLIVFR